MNICIIITLLIHLLVFAADGKTIISIKFPQDDLIRGHGHIDFRSGLSAKHTKRDLSLSYAATNIDSKEGTRVKTLTVIKNVGKTNNGGGHQDKLAIDPNLYKDEKWATVFRKNFETFDVVPDVPDIDDLFEFVNKKNPSGTDAKASEVPATDKDAKAPEKPKETPKEKEKIPESTTKKITEETDASVNGAEAAGKEAPVEKITGDAELLPHTKQKSILRMQSLDKSGGRKLRTRESLVNVNYSTPLHSVHQYYDNYVQEIPKGYDYPKPCPCPPNSIAVTTPSGRTYDIPQSNSSGTSGGNPYLAPAITRRPIVVNIPQNNPQQPVQPNYSSVNSILPPLQQSPSPAAQVPATLPATARPTQPVLPQPQAPSTTVLPPLQTPTGLAPAPTGAVGAVQFPTVGTQPPPNISTSQRPYVAPSLRNGLGINRGPPQSPIYRNGIDGVPPSIIRTNIFVGVANRPHTFRSRGLKY